MKQRPSGGIVKLHVQLTATIRKSLTPISLRQLPSGAKLTDSWTAKSWCERWTTTCLTPSSALQYAFVACSNANVALHLCMTAIAMLTLCIRYLVKWKEDGDELNSWEAECDCVGAVDALHDFLVSQPKASGCKFGHVRGVCKCHLPLIISGQDESIFKAYQKSSFQWVVNGVRGLRKKTDGPGEMVSGFRDELRGFGLPVSSEELLKINAYRKAKGLEPLDASPGVRFLSYGKNKDGYWTYEHFAQQTADVLDIYEALHPDWQIAVEVDWSSGHSKHRSNALSVLSMRVSFGGKQSIPHASLMTEGCLGSEEGKCLEVGQLQYFHFRSAEEKGDGQCDPPPYFKPEMPAAEYIGLAKGKKHILVERGLFKQGMIEKVEEDDPKGRDQTLSMDHVLSSCEDFENETTALQ
eukprot:6175268-Pleurochrysis_carterae.AAC.1